MADPTIGMYVGYEEIDRRRRREDEHEKLTRFICEACKSATREHRTHPGVQHLPGICDCPCR